MNLERALAFLQSGTFQPGTMEYKWWEYYDSVTLANATQPNGYKFFAIPEGAGGKDLSDTNWQVANQMPESERMAVMFFCFYYIPLEVRTQAEFQLIMDLMKTAYFEFKVHNKSAMIQMPLAAAFSTYMPVQVLGAGVGDQNLSRTMISGCYELGIEIPLAAKTTITAQIVFSAATAAALDGDKVYLSMVGPKYNLT